MGPTYEHLLDVRRVPLRGATPSLALFWTLSACGWLWCPLGLLSAFVLKLPPMWVYFILSLDETIKMPANIIHYRKKGWLRNITRDKIT